MYLSQEIFLLYRQFPDDVLLEVEFLPLSPGPDGGPAKHSYHRVL